MKAVEALDRRIIASQADVRDVAALRAAFDAGVAQLGPLDIVSANAGICTDGPGHRAARAWQDTLDINLTGVWNTIVVAMPSMIERGQGGSIIFTSSTAGIKGSCPNLAYLYTAAKHAWSAHTPDATNWPRTTSGSTPCTRPG